eukprot:g57604.t1
MLPAHLGSVGQRARESNLRSTPARDSPDIPPIIAHTRSVSMLKAASDSPSVSLRRVESDTYLPGLQLTTTDIPPIIAHTRSVPMSKAASDSPSVSVRRVESDTYLPGEAASDSPDMYVFHVGTDTPSSVTVLQVPTAHVSQMTTHSSSTYASDKLTPSDLPVLARVSPSASPSISHSRSLSIGKGAPDSPPVSLRHVGTDAPLPFQQVTTGKSSSHSPSHSRSPSRLSQVLRPDSNRASVSTARVSGSNSARVSPLTPTRSLVAEVAIGPSGRAPRSQSNASSRSMNHLHTLPRTQSNATNSTSYNQLPRLRSQSKATFSKSSGHLPEIDAVVTPPHGHPSTTAWMILWFDEHAFSLILPSHTAFPLAKDFGSGRAEV